MHITVIIIITIIIGGNSSSIASPVLVIFKKTVLILHNIIFSFFPLLLLLVVFFICYKVASTVSLFSISFFKIRIKAGTSLACFVFVSLSFCRFSLRSPKALRREKRAQTQADKFQCYPYIHTPWKWRLAEWSVLLQKQNPCSAGSKYFTIA